MAIPPYCNTHTIPVLEYGYMYPLGILAVCHSMVAIHTCITYCHIQNIGYDLCKLVLHIFNTGPWR